MPYSGVIHNIKISSLASAVPRNRVLNEALAAEFGSDVDRIIKMTGVKERHVALPQQTASDLAFTSCKKILDNDEELRDEVSALIFVSQTPDYILPATACVLHGRLGLKKQCMAFDINLGCSGFTYGLVIAASILATHGGRILLCGGDTVSKLVSKQDRSTALLFGDAGFAALVESTTDVAAWYHNCLTSGDGYNKIIVPAGAQRNCLVNREFQEIEPGIKRSEYDLFLDGPEVFNFTITEVPQAINELISQNNSNSDDYDYLLLHQANLFIMKQIAKMTKFPMEKVPISIDRFGNTSVASIPLTLCDKFHGQTKSLRLLLAGYGVGLSWAVMDLVLDSSALLPIIESDDYYGDAR